MPLQGASIAIERPFGNGMAVFLIIARVAAGQNGGWHGKRWRNNVDISHWQPFERLASKQGVRFYAL